MLDQDSGKIGTKIPIQLLREIGLSNIIVLRTIVFIIFGTEKPWAETLVIQSLVGIYGRKWQAPTGLCGCEIEPYANKY